MEGRTPSKVTRVPDILIGWWYSPNCTYNLKRKVQNLKIKSFRDNKMGYRGEIMAKFKPVMGSYETILELFESNEYEIGDRVVQLLIIPYPQIELEEVEELSDTERGYGGFGSTNI